jgi:TolA-binding protein
LPTSNTQGAANAIAEQQQYEEQIASMNSELDDLNSIINDPEMDKINFVQLDENAFK